MRGSIIGILKYMLLWMMCISQSVDAHVAPTYEQWKLQQEQHDRRLKQKNTKVLAVAPIIQREIKPQSVVTPTVNVQQIPQVLGTALKVNINQASAQELSAKLDSIGAKKAQAIVQYREKNGAFKRIDELKNVKGIGDKIYARNQNRLKLTD